MRYVRFEREGRTSYGVLEGETVQAIDGDILGAHTPGKQTFPLAQVRLLAPVQPPNILAIGLNYKSHAAEGGMALPERPLIFLKATTSLAGPGDAIVRPAIAPDEVDYEAELAVVIGRRARDVAEADVDAYILGYTCANDVSARDCQLRQDTQWARAKSFDSFCPLGPWIETELDPRRLRIASRVNGEVMQESDTSRMIFGVRELVSYCSRNMTLLPGTVILTGTPEGVGFARTPPRFLRAGDRVQVEIEGIGTLENPVV